MDDIEFYSTYCTGCGLCVSCSNAKLNINKKGFLSPALNDATFQRQYCMVAKANCDYISKPGNVWGEYINVWRGYSTDPELRMNASSGGALSEIASFLLERKHLDGVIHIGVEAEDDPLATRVYCSTSRSEVISHCGSRYIQTSPLSNVCDLLGESKHYVFIGKPCDCLILRHYLNEHPEYPGKVDYFLSFFCAGTPSLQANHQLIKDMGCYEPVETLSYRGNGWPGFATIKTHDGHEYKMEYDKSWGKILGRDKNKICRLCMDGIGLAADIVCADAWYIVDGKPDFSEHDGRNLIISRTACGEELLKDMINNSALSLTIYDEFEDEMPMIQKYQYERRKTMLFQVLALKICGYKVVPYKLSNLQSFAKSTALKQKVDILWGTLKRIYRGRYK